MTRPEIAHAVQTFSQFVSDPRQPHLIAVHRTICYLQGTIAKGLFYSSSSSLQLTTYADADWADYLDTRLSTAEWCMFLGSYLISWKSKK